MKLSRSIHSRAPVGFTLVELLIVIVIIAVLVALSLFGYTRARGVADKAVAIGYLKEIQLANASYAADNGRFVTVSAKSGGDLSGSWHNNWDFTNNLRGIPNSTDTSPELRGFPEEKFDRRARTLQSPGWDHIKGNYGAFEKDPTNNSWTSGDDFESSFSAAQLSNPGRTAAFATALDWRIKSWSSYTGEETRNGQGRMAFRHGGKALVVFYDGHVEEKSKSDMQKIEDNGGKSHPFWKGDH
ncbi:MAG: prepilin-type N-terminal cleavage/methylation domain-containing protein [Akkermansiaceae bacterium]